MTLQTTETMFQTSLTETIETPSGSEGGLPGTIDADDGIESVSFLGAEIADGGSGVATLVAPSSSPIAKDDDDDDDDLMFDDDDDDDVDDDFDADFDEFEDEDDTDSDDDEEEEL